MPVYGNLQTTKGYGESVADLCDIFRKWRVAEYHIPTMRDTAADGGKVTLTFKMDGEWIELACHKFTWGRDAPAKNIRALVGALDAFRLADERGIANFRAKIVQGFKALPGGIPAAAPQARDPNAVLGVAPDAPLEVKKAAWRALIQIHHPDHNGDAGKFKEIQEAAEKLGLA